MKSILNFLVLSNDADLTLRGGDKQRRPEPHRVDVLT